MVRYYTTDGPDLAKDALRRAEEAMTFYGLLCGGPIEWGRWQWDGPERKGLPYRIIRFSEGTAKASPDVLELAKSAVIPQFFRHSWRRLECRLDPLPFIADSVLALARLEEIQTFFSDPSCEISAEILEFLSKNTGPCVST
jgi:hypothetical protein